MIGAKPVVRKRDRQKCQCQILESDEVQLPGLASHTLIRILHIFDFPLPFEYLGVTPMHTNKYVHTIEE